MLIGNRTSFVTETVFSHESKIELVRDAVGAGYIVTVHVVMVPEALAVARVANRMEVGGHSVPEAKVVGRWRRLWPLVTSAIGLVDGATVYDNSRAGTPFPVVTGFEHGRLVGKPLWPAWTPDVLRNVGA